MSFIKYSFFLDNIIETFLEIFKKITLKKMFTNKPKEPLLY